MKKKYYNPPIIRSILLSSPSILDVSTGGGETNEQYSLDVTFDVTPSEENLN